MSVRVNWLPINVANIASYEIQRADNLAGAPWGVLGTVANDVHGANYDGTTGTFFFNDPTGDISKFYRLVAIDILGQRSLPSDPFQPAQDLPPPPANSVKVDHNYGVPGALRYQAPNGAPIENAVIRIYRKIDFDQANTDTPLAITLTNADGNWVDPVSLTPGFTYVIQFAKEGLYGPDHTEVIV